MPYLIDGNNLMPLVRALTRKDLLAKVSVFARVKKIKASVVFDGAEEDFFPDGSSYQSVKIFYARPSSADADTRIKKMVEDSRERRTLIVVTSDRALGDYCRRCGARVVSTRDFRRKLDEAEETNLEKSRLEGVKSEELSSWMRYFGVDETDDL